MLETLSSKPRGRKQKKAGAEAARLAREFGDLDNDGVPMITDIADGAW